MIRTQRTQNEMLAMTIALLLLGLALPSAVWAQQKSQQLNDRQVAALIPFAKKAIEELQATGKMSPRARNTLELLLGQETAPRGAVPMAAELLGALCDIKGADIDAATQLLAKRAIEFMGKVGVGENDEVNALVRVMHDPRPSFALLRVDTVKCLTELNNPGVNAALMKGCKCEFMPVRIECIRGLTQRKAMEAIPLFLAFAADKGLAEEQRVDAARSLGRLRATQIVEQMIDVLAEDASVPVRLGLAQTLGEIGEKADMPRDQREALAERLGIEVGLQESPEVCRSLRRAVQLIEARLKKTNTP